jgi:hypothetical protein
MITRTLIKRSLAIAVLALGIGQAQATVFNLNLSGTVSDGTYSSYDWNTTHYDTWWLNLSGLDSSNAISVAVGDTVNATITLDHSFTIPSSVDQTWIELSLSNSNGGFPAGDTGTTNDTVAFFNGGVAGPSGTGSNCSSNGFFPSCNLFYGPSYPSITFDQVIMSFDVEKFGTMAPGETATLDSAQFGYYLFSPAQVVSPVSEPETYSMILVGLGLLGVMARRRKALHQ